MKNILIEIKWFLLDLYFRISDLFGYVSQKLFAPPLVRAQGYIKHEEAFFTEWEKDSATYEKDVLESVPVAAYLVAWLDVEMSTYDDLETAIGELELNVKHQGL